jgi:hypothetical protein
MPRYGTHDNLCQPIQHKNRFISLSPKWCPSHGTGLTPASSGGSPCARSSERRRICCGSRNQSRSSPPIGRSRRRHRRQAKHERTAIRSGRSRQLRQRRKNQVAKVLRVGAQAHPISFGGCGRVRLGLRALGIAKLGQSLKKQPETKRHRISQQHNPTNIDQPKE